MQSKASGKITADQRRWQEAVRGLGSIISGQPAVIHHPVGITGKHNKVPIGPWWIIPLTDEEHKALHNGETFGFESRKAFEKTAFAWVHGKLFRRGAVLPPDGVVPAIMDYHR